MPQKMSVLCEGFRAPWELAGVDKHTSVLLAFSGGADSCALLDLLASRAQKDGFSLMLAHVDHGIRGEESLRDRQFCAEIAKRYGLELCVLEADVPRLAKQNRRSLEEEARVVRYAFFERLMRERKIPLLATAHHADDQLETLLFRLCRGTGLAGLCGISPVRAFADGYLTRPLLQVPKREILDYCARKKLDFVTDSTNFDVSYARNKIRAEVIPVLETLFDGVQRRVTDLTATLSEDEAFLSSLAEDFLNTHGQGARLSVDSLRALPIPVRKRVLRLWCSQETGKEPERTHLDQLLDLTERIEETTMEISLPGGYTAVREFGFLTVLAKRTAVSAPFELPFEIGEQLLPQSCIRLIVKKEEIPTKIHNLSIESTINSSVNLDIIKGDVWWRSRREGDTLLQGGMHRKLRKLYNAAKIPPRFRDGIPLLCDGEGIVWAPFVGVRDGMTVNRGAYTVQVLISINENEKDVDFHVSV